MPRVEGRRFPGRVAMPFLALSLAFCLTGPPPAGAVDTPGATQENEAPAGPVSVEVGSKAPDFTLAGPGGNTYHLADKKGKRSVVLVFFRGTW